MPGNEQQIPPVATPKKGVSHRVQCAGCPCHQFQSDEAVTSAVDSDARMEALIGWLSGILPKNDYEGRASSTDTTPTILCPNRLNASIAILNAIRDACRPYLESSTPPLINNSSPSPKKSANNNVRPKINPIAATYEDSFPSLSSTASTTKAPTMLVGRKKSKGPKKNNNPLPLPFSTAPSTSSVSVAPTMLIGRKKSKGSSISMSINSKQSSNNVGSPGWKNTKQMTTPGSPGRSSFGKPQNQNYAARKNDSTNANNTILNFESRMGVGAKKSLPSTSNLNDSAGLDFFVPKAKKKIKPVTVSLSASSSSSSSGAGRGALPQAPKSLKSSEGNISSLPSQDTTEISSVEEESKSTTINSVPTIKVGMGTTTIEIDTKNNTSDTMRQQQMRLANIYSTILKAHLAPFLLLELHLLVRLVSLSDKSSDTPKPKHKTQQFSGIFPSEQSCREFAAKTLTALEAVIINMGHETMKMFESLPAIRAHCPRLCTALQDIIHAGNSTLLFETDQKALGSNTNTPHLTLPFDHARDSRHNYRSADLSRLFKEREELRDSFLYQLRAFQDVRGRLVEQEQAEKQIGSIKHQSREMLNNLSAGNTLWFVNFFCDLLIQVGLVPVGETDSEVLKQIGDKKRLQKLHMRFTSKSGQTNKSSRKLRIDQKGPSPTSNSVLPEQSFPGHQEFFSIFLRAGDSYKFNIHLKRQLSQLITKMATVNETKGLCDHIAKTQMLAKFLGLLTFSPNWDLSSGNDTDGLSSEIMDINLPSINIKDCIEAAWERSRLVIVIPWVVQFLGMMKWDEASRRHQYYVDIFALLWSVNHQCLPQNMKHHSYHQTNMILLSFQLDTLFHDVVGLAPAQNLPILTLPTQKSSRTAGSANLVSLDDLPLWFSKNFLFPSIPYLKDLCELLKDLAHSNGKMGGTASARKVRPNTISNLGCIDPGQKFVSRISYAGENNMSPWPSKHPGTPMSKGGIRERLVDSFFHQHKDLQQLCEIIVERAIKNFTETVSKTCIPPIFKNGATSFEDYFNKSPGMTLEEYIKLLMALGDKASKEATTLMNKDLDRIIKGALQLLAPSETKSKVVEVASSLAINHATQKGRNAIRLIISEEKKKLMDEFVRKENKVRAGVPLTSAKKGHVPERESPEPNDSTFQCIADLTASLKGYCELGIPVHNGLQSVRQKKSKVLSDVQRNFIGADSSQTVVEFELQIISMLKDLLFDPTQNSIHIIEATIEAFDVLSLLGKLGYASSPDNENLELLLCNTNNLAALIDQVKNANGTELNENLISHETIGNFLFILLEGTLVDYRPLEKALIDLVKVNEDAALVSNILLNKLASSRAGTVEAANGLVIMVRLQRILLRDNRNKGISS